MENTDNTLEISNLAKLNKSDLNYITLRLGLICPGIEATKITIHGQGIHRLIRFEYKEEHGFKFFTKQFDYLSIQSTPKLVAYVCYITLKDLSNVLVPRTQTTQNELFPKNTF